ncbi:MAG: class I SAM-dependent methyltransferase [Halioglobus sp.]
MKQGEASRTAEGAAAARAMHTLLVESPIFEDPYAVKLTSPAWRRLSTTPVLSWLAKNILLRPLRSVQAQVVVRSRYAEELLLQAVAAGVRQYVIVGAGFDSFSFRRRDLESALRVFEFDHADTQRLKLQRLLALEEPMPENLQCIAVDFEQETMADALRKSDYDLAQPGFFSWLGTTPYLTNAATLATLRAIAASAAGGSEIVFDYLVPAALVPESERAAMRRLKRFTDRRGEPLIGEFNPSEIEPLLESAGFELIENLDQAEQVKRYFSQRTDGLAPLAAGYLVHARVKPSTNKDNIQ